MSRSLIQNQIAFRPGDELMLEHGMWLCSNGDPEIYEHVQGYLPFPILSRDPNLARKPPDTQGTRRLEKNDG